MHRLAIATIVFFSLVGSTRAAESLPVAEPLPVNMLERAVAYVRIPTFTSNITDRIRPTLLLAASRKPRGIILDLRDHRGGDINGVHAILEALLPKGTPYMRHITATYLRIVATTQSAVIKKSTPVVVLRDARTMNEADIVIYALQKLRHAGVVEFSSDRAALKRVFKQNAAMDQYRPIKDSVFFITPDARIIANEGGEEEDVIGRAIALVREMSPWDEPKRNQDSGFSARQRESAIGSPLAPPR